MSIIPIRRKWKEGTYMQLISTKALRRYVTTMEDRDAYRLQGKPISRRKISQGELARSAGVHRSFISQLATGERRSCTPLIAERICDRLDIELDELFVTHRPAASTKARRRRPAPTPTAQAVAA